MAHYNQRSKAELALMFITTTFLLGGIGMATSGLLVSDWAYLEFKEGIVIVNAKVGLLQTEICDYQGCRSHWFTEKEYYGRHPQAHFESQSIIRVLVTSGISAGFVALVHLYVIWSGQIKRWWIVAVLQSMFYVMSLYSASACLSASLVTSAKLGFNHIGWAPHLSGCAGVFFLVGACFVAAFCRYDAKKTTKTNDVTEEKKVPIDKAVIVNYDYNSYCITPGFGDKKQPPV